MIHADISLFGENVGDKWLVSLQEATEPGATRSEAYEFVAFSSRSCKWLNSCCKVALCFGH